MISYPDGLSTPECCHKVPSVLGHRVILWRMQQAQTTSGSSRFLLPLRRFWGLSCTSCLQRSQSRQEQGQQSGERAGDATAELQRASPSSDARRLLSMAGYREKARCPSGWRRRADSNRCIRVLQTLALTTWQRRPLVPRGGFEPPRATLTTPSRWRVYQVPPPRQ
jgi:hypothetical protein